jgi:hypothetical protein
MGALGRGEEIGGAAGACGVAGASATAGDCVTTGSAVGSTTGAGVTTGSTVSIASVFLRVRGADFFAGVASVSAAVVSSDFLRARFGLASSGCSSRVSPSRSARALTRSASCSISVEDCVFTSKPIFFARSRTS